MAAIIDAGPGLGVDKLCLQLGDKHRFDAIRLRSPGDVLRPAQAAPGEVATLDHARLCGGDLCRYV